MSVVLLLWAACYAVIAGVAIARSRTPTTAGSPRAVTPGAAARVLLVRPCTGDDAWLEAALTSLPRTRHRLTVVLSVASRDDDAWPIVQRAADRLRAEGVAAQAMVAPAAVPNAKCGQLAAVVRAHAEPIDVVIGVDADVDLDSLALDTLIDPLLANAPAPAAVFAAPIEVATPQSLADRASRAVLDSSLHAFALLAGLDPAGFVGKAFAVRADALAAIGGFAALGDRLGEDMELARRLRASGHTTACVGVVGSRARGRSGGEVIARYARWIGVIRAQRPGLLASYPLLFFPLLPLTVAVMAARDASGLVALGVAAVARGAVAIAARARSHRPLHLASVVPAIVLADGLLAIAWLRALASSRVSWRGRALRVGAGGRLTAG